MDSSILITVGALLLSAGLVALHEFAPLERIGKKKAVAAKTVPMPK